MAIDGKFVILKVGIISVLGQTSGGMEATVEMLETTDKLSKDPATGITHKTYIAGDRDGTQTVEGNASFEDNNWSLLYEMYLTAVAPATIYYGGTEPGEKYYSQSGWLMSISRTDPQNGISTYSAQFQKTGVPTENTVAA